MKIGYIKESDPTFVVERCKAHTHYEGNNFEEKNQRELLYEFIFNSDLNLKCLVVEHHSEIIGYATFCKQFSSREADHYIYLECLYLKKNTRQ